MKTDQYEPVYSTGADKLTYLDIQAEVGITKHMGGYLATNRLYELCHLNEAEEVLDVGCGIGVGPVYIAKQFGCQVVAVDISEKMLTWTGQRARRERVADKITVQLGDVRDLPFEDNRFDAVIVESVLAFVADKIAAINELVRVTKPGGYVGLNESYWLKEPPAGIMEQSVYTGTDILQKEEWHEIWEMVSLEERKIEAYDLDIRQEVKDRISWVGWRSILPAWWRMLKLVLFNRKVRRSLKIQSDIPVSDMVNTMEYALFVGRKPA